MVHRDFFPVARAFGELGLSLRSVFPDPDFSLSLYNGYTWRLFRNGLFLSIHAVPADLEADRSFWECWYTEDEKEVFHRIYVSKKPAVPFHDICTPSASDAEPYPKEVMGRFWYVIWDLDMLAWACRLLD